MENDNEAKGVGNQQDYMNRIYDPRVGRFLSVDRVTAMYPMLTPYQFASNRPIDGSDLDGNEWTTETTTLNAGTPQLTVTKAMIVRVKVENQSTIVTDANIIKAKAEVYKRALENDFKLETTEVIDNISTKVIYKTEVILDYTPPTKDDGAIGHLIFDDRVSTTTITTNGNTVTTVKSSTPGDNKGVVNHFNTRIGITMDGIIVPDGEISETTIHEGGHSAGLRHPWKLSPDEQAAMPKLDQSNPATRDQTLIKKNFMNSGENTDNNFLPNKNAVEILPEQIKLMFQKIEKDKKWTPKEVREGSKP